MIKKEINKAFTPQKAQKKVRFQEAKKPKKSKKKIKKKQLMRLLKLLAHKLTTIKRNREERPARAIEEESEDEKEEEKVDAADKTTVVMGKPQQMPRKKSFGEISTVKPGEKEESEQSEIGSKKLSPEEIAQLQEQNKNMRITGKDDINKILSDFIRENNMIDKIKNYTAAKKSDFEAELNKLKTYYVNNNVNLKSSIKITRKNLIQYIDQNFTGSGKTARKDSAIKVLDSVFPEDKESKGLFSKLTSAFK